MEEWIVDLAAALGEEPVSSSEMGAVLKLAREVAHGVERKLAPVSTFLAGVSAGRGAAAGEDRGRSLERAVAAALAMVPPPASGRGASDDAPA